MLVKSELLSIPVEKYPVLKLKDWDKKYTHYAATAKITDLPRSGEVLSVDIYTIKDKKIYLRFFSDGNNFQVYKEGKWGTRKVTSYLTGSTAIVSSPKADEIAKRVLDKEDGHGWITGDRIGSQMDRFAERINSRKWQIQADKKYKLEKQHLSMFPAYPKDFTNYCENNIFPTTYIFISKITNNKRSAICGSCGHEFVACKEHKHGTEGKCPNCKKDAKYYGKWINPVKEKALVCMAHKKDNQLLLRWIEVHRSFTDVFEKKYSMWDKRRVLFLDNNGKPKRYCYYQGTGHNYYYGWVRPKGDTVNYEKAHIYKSNLSRVFGQSYYNVNLREGLKNYDIELDFLGLLDNLKSIPATEYIFKYGLVRLATELHEVGAGEGKDFSSVLGINKQYLPLYQKYDISAVEHEVMKESHTWIDEEIFLKFRSLDIPNHAVDRIVEMLEKDSFKKVINYLYKQKQVHRDREIDQILTWYRDYKNMSEILGVDMHRKSIRFPKDIKIAHDVVMEKYVPIRDKEENRIFEAAMKKLYENIELHRNKKYQIVLPKCKQDFVKEGQSLSHCLGRFDHYYKNHMEGTRMIFFIRKNSAPDKPYFTLEADMKKLQICQLYGYGDCVAPGEVRKFVNGFLRGLRTKKRQIA